MNWVVKNSLNVGMATMPDPSTPEQPSSRDAAK